MVTRRRGVKHTRRRHRHHAKTKKKLSKRYERYINTSGFEILDVVNTLRIEPYLTNTRQRIILDTIVKSTQLYEKFNHSDGR